MSNKGRKTTPEDVAQWMLSIVEQEGDLYQETAVYDIQEKFGEEFTYLNDGGNPAISRKVLSSFSTISLNSVVWERGERRWRKREEYDEPGRQQY